MSLIVKPRSLSTNSLTWSIYLLLVNVECILERGTFTKDPLKHRSNTAIFDKQLLLKDFYNILNSFVGEISL